MISAQGLTKKFGSVVALTDLTFKVEPGEFVFLTGSSGSGKTTLLRMILRDLKSDTGELEVNGQLLNKLSASKLPAYRRSIGPIFQDFKLLADRSVSENVALPLEVRSVKQSDVKEAVRLALDLVGLSSKSEVFPSQLSGGELQRVAIARAVVGKPKLILADEPTGNLDPKTARTIVKLLKDIHQELKTTILMATHNADVVNHSSLRVLTLDQGKLVKDASHGKYE